MDSPDERIGQLLSQHARFTNRDDYYGLLLFSHAVPAQRVGPGDDHRHFNVFSWHPLGSRHNCRLGIGGPECFAGYPLESENRKITSASLVAGVGAYGYTMSSNNSYHRIMLG